MPPRGEERTASERSLPLVAVQRERPAQLTLDASMSRLRTSCALLALLQLLRIVCAILALRRQSPGRRSSALSARISRSSCRRRASSFLASAMSPLRTSVSSRRWSALRSSRSSLSLRLSTRSARGRLPGHVHPPGGRLRCEVLDRAVARTTERCCPWRNAGSLVRPRRAGAGSRSPAVSDSRLRAQLSSTPCAG